MKWPCSLASLWPSRALQHRASRMRRDGGIVVREPARVRWAKWHPVARERQRGFVTVGMLTLGFGRNNFKPQNLFKNGEPGFHFEAYNPDDLLKRRNRLTYSSQFSNAAWTRTNILSVTENADGVGDLVVPSTTSATHALSQSVASAGVSNTVTVRAKAGGYNFIILSLSGTGNVWFNVGTGAVGSNTTSMAATIAPAPGVSGYYDCTVAAVTTGAVAFVYAAVTDGSATYAGDGVSGVYLARAQLEWNTTVASAYQEVTDWNTEYTAAALEQISMWQESSGLTPVTGVEQSVGMWLDTKGGKTLARGPDVAPALTAANWTVTNSDATHIVTWQPGSGFRFQSDTTSPALTVAAAGTLVVGNWYEVEITVTNWVSGGMKTDSLGVPANTGFGAAGAGNGVYRVRGQASATSMQLTRNTTNVDLIVSKVVVKQIPSGAHALQATASQRPVLSARVNLLTKTEQFDDAGWTKRGTAAVGAAAPDGTGKLISGIGASGTNDMFQSVSGLPVGAAYTPRCEIWPVSSSGTLRLDNPSNGSAGAWTINLALLTAGQWNAISATHPAVTVNAAFVGSSTGGGGHYFYAGSGAPLSFYLRRTDLRTADDAAKNIPAYQRVNTSTDYDTAGFPHYLKFDGSDDGMVTPSIDFSGVDKAAVWAGATKLSDAAAGAVVELSASATANNGAFYVVTPTAASGANLQQALKGDSTAQATTANGITAPSTVLYGGLFSISGPTNILRINGVQASQNLTSVGGGNFGNYPIYIGRRAGSTLPFNGRIYSLTVRGSTTPSSEAFIAKMNRYAANLLAISI